MARIGECWTRLSQLYASLGGADWKNRTNWCSGEAISTWHGVDLNESDEIVKLKLSANNLHGNLHNVAFC